MSGIARGCDPNVRGSVGPNLIGKCRESRRPLIPAARALVAGGLLTLAGVCPVMAQGDSIGGGELRICGTPPVAASVCPLSQTDVQASITGLSARVTVKQVFQNNTGRKIEAVYVFPLPSQAAVDDMTMTVGDRRVVAQIKTREEARRTYDAAVAAGHVASLLDQERPNIFTQSVGNIEPGATVTIEISYFETIKYEEGRYEFAFPMLVGPRYIPGGGSAPAPMTTGLPTPQVPDANKITPPVAPKGMRAGHDINLTVHIAPVTLWRTFAMHMQPYDIRSELHEIEEEPSVQLANGTAIRLKNKAEIPNRDFVLSYSHGREQISDAFFTHTDSRGTFFSLLLQPPQRVQPDAVVSRELVFVLDTSGSMQGYPIEKAKRVMSGLIDTMNPGDTFNLITFSGDTRILWPEPRPSTEKNRADAQAFLSQQRGGGGTEMMKAIHAALVRPDVAEWPLVRPSDLAEAPHDGRKVTLRIAAKELTVLAQDGVAPSGFDIPAGGARTIRALIRDWKMHKHAFDPRSPEIVELRGEWKVRKGRPILDVTQAEWPAASPDIRVVCFFTDGYVGNDLEIVDAVKKNAAGTRVFSFGIGNAVNRFLLDGMAHAGRGEVEYVTLGADADQSVERFKSRIQSPVLTDIDIDWGTLAVEEVYPARIPDLFSAKPIVVHGRLSGPASGTITLRGNTGAGGFERVIDVSPAASAKDPREAEPGGLLLKSAYSSLPALWARAKIEDLMNRDLAATQHGNMPEPLKIAITELGLAYRLMTQFTSFVAVEELTVTVGGQPTKVLVPVEMPDGVSHEGVFGGELQQRLAMSSMSGSGLWGGVHLGTTPRAAAPSRSDSGVFGGGGAIAQESAGRGARQKAADVKKKERPTGRDEETEIDAPDQPSKPADKLATVLRSLADRVARDGKDGSLTVDTLKIVNHKVDVMITLLDTSRETLAALEKLGFEKAGEAVIAKIVIGRIDVRKLDALAELACVTRIEPLPTP